ncbi:MAG: toxin-antitoxin system HicB family antitoxin [Marmoricola sp.]|nr:toxin-antitoxin system HicB family antitoxin [Marmoricola sp.]
MELTPYVDRLRSDLADAAAAGGAEAQQAAERLALALDPATRMVLLEALSHGAAEITGELEHHAVEVRMNGREPEFVVTELEPTRPIAPPPPPEPPTPPQGQGQPEDDSQSRITLRLPESVKARAEEAANQLGQSLNAWLVDAVRDALDPRERVDLQLGSNRITVSGGEGGRRRQVRGWVS